MSSPVVFFLALLWISFCGAKVEIEIEGKHGWAKDLPTWRLSPTNWISRFFFSDKPATGYHIWLEVVVISVFHLPYLFIRPSFAIEAKILALFLFFCVLEDFLWFVLNPFYGIKSFRPDRIWWHRQHWWWIAPRDYYVFIVAGTILYLLSFHL